MHHHCDEAPRSAFKPRPLIEGDTQRLLLGVKNGQMSYRARSERRVSLSIDQNGRINMSDDRLDTILSGGAVPGQDLRPADPQLEGTYRRGYHQAIAAVAEELQRGASSQLLTWLSRCKVPVWSGGNRHRASTMFLRRRSVSRWKPHEKDVNHGYGRCRVAGPHRLPGSAGRCVHWQVGAAGTKDSGQG